MLRGGPAAAESRSRGWSEHDEVQGRGAAGGAWRQLRPVVPPRGPLGDAQWIGAPIGHDPLAKRRRQRRLAGIVVIPKRKRPVRRATLGDDLGADDPLEVVQ